MNEQQRKSFEEACQAIIEWKKTNLCPHDIIVIENDHATVFNGAYGFPIKTQD